MCGNLCNSLNNINNKYACIRRISNYFHDIVKKYTHVYVCVWLDVGMREYTHYTHYYMHIIYCVFIRIPIFMFFFLQTVRIHNKFNM